MINSLYIIYNFNDINKIPTINIINTIKKTLNILYDDIDKCSVYLINKSNEEINRKTKSNLYTIIHSYFAKKDIKDIENIKFKLLFVNIYDKNDRNYEEVNKKINLPDLIVNLEKNLPEDYIKKYDLYKKMYVSTIFKSYIQYLLDPNKNSNIIHSYINQSGGKNNDIYIKSLKKKSTNELLNICKRYKIKSTKKINNKIFPLKDATLINKIIDYKLKH